MQHHILLLLAILLSSASYSAGQQVLQLKDEPCQNYEEISAALLDAKSAWVDPDCYDFTYTFTGFQIGQPEPQSVRVRNGVAENGEKTIDDFFTMIESLCVEGCPNVGAARCEMEFAMEGYPMSIFIDVNQYQPDNRRAYIIEDFNFVVCEPTDDNDGEPEESPQQSPVMAPVSETTTNAPTILTPVDEITTNAPTQQAAVDEVITDSPTQQVTTVDDGITNAPTQMALVDETTTNSPTPVVPSDEETTNSPTTVTPTDAIVSDSPTQMSSIDESTTMSPTQMSSMDETTTNSPSQLSNPVDLESEERSVVILNGFRMSLSTEEGSALTETTLSTVMTQYLNEDLDELEGFVGVRLISMNDDMTGLSGRQAQPYESHMFFGEAVFVGEAPEELDVLRIQAMALADSTRIQEVLNDNGIDAVLMNTEVYEKDNSRTNIPLQAESRAEVLPRSLGLLSITAAAMLVI